MTRIEALVKHMEKTADAMARAYRRGDIDLNSPSKTEAFSEKIKSIDPRNSGNMGMLSNRAFAGGKEGNAYLGALRGQGLGVRKEFIVPDKGSHNHMSFHNADTRTPENRAVVMNANTDIFPKVYRAVNGVKAGTGFMDLEYIHGIDLDKAPKDVQTNAMNNIHSRLENASYTHITEADNAWYNKDSGMSIEDIRPRNIRISPNGQAKVVDPMVFHDSDKYLAKGFEFIKSRLLKRK